MDSKQKKDKSAARIDAVKYTCPQCGECAISTSIHQDRFVYGSGESAVELSVDLPVRHCSDCDFQFVDSEGEDIQQAAICQHLGVLPPQAIVDIRKKHGLSRAAFAEITGLGEASLSRWEKGINIQNPGNDRYIRLLEHSEVMVKLQDIAHEKLKSLHSDSNVFPFRSLAESEDLYQQQSQFSVALGELMYVTTFYSFKGGVGRTMALVNTGVELARRGRKVLLVDFDLEAPGLDTFEAVKPKKTTPGIVDFVRRYLDTGQAPEVAEFLEKCPEIGDDGGKLWLMPAGTSRPNYADSFRQIDWGDLYEQRDGFILFEDLKAQWKEVLQPDYVLIDSRTGHTDVGGICTRQLPDSVAMLFFPNEQNLTGLTKVVADIRSESEEPRGKKIHLHFIMSNVPDLDDEDRILEKKIKAFQKKLDFERDPLIVHRYDSLSLLNQVVFTKDRPRSRLAEEYRQLVKEIISQNLEDREGALEYLRKSQRAVHSDSFRHESSEEENQKLLDKIRNLHDSDGEVLFQLGVLKQEQWEPEQAASLFGRAIERGYSKPQVHMRRAHCTFRYRPSQ